MQPTQIGTPVVKVKGQGSAGAVPEEHGQGLRLGRVQRRQLCVMFVDLVGSTELAANYDLEETRDVLLAFLDAAAARIEAAHGFVARFMGDGLLAYFGYPEARAEAATLALHAAREVQRAVAQLTGPGGEALTARIGVATGEVMIGDIVGRGLAAESMVVGAAANLAARLQGAAPAGAVLACETTRALAADAFAFAPTEPLRLKGLASDLIAFEVLAATGGDRFASRRTLGLAPLVGRDDELRRLERELDLAKSGARRISVTGEPGIGKSRLLHAFKSMAVLPRGRWLATTGAATAIDTPYFGLAQLLRRTFAGGSEWDENRHPARLIEAALRLGTPPGGLLRMAQAAGLALGDHALQLDATGASGATRLREDCRALLTRAAANGPIVLAIEDAHWLDASTAALLVELWPDLLDLPVLILASSRTSLGGVFAEAEQIDLGPLEPEALMALAQYATGGLIDSAVLDQVTTRAQGVPLFAEELARLLIQNPQSTHSAIPATLSDLLMSRLDRSEHGLELTQLVALLGEDAVPETLATLAGLDAATMARALDRLETDLVVLAHESPQSPVVLRHALFGEAAYAAMPRKARAAAHRAAARLLADRAAPANRIARHFDAASDHAKAADWWKRAGHIARRQRALPEAQNAYERAIGLIETGGGPSPERQADQLELRSAHFEVLQLSAGYSAPATISAGEKLRELVERQGNLQQQLTAVTGQWAAASSAGEYDLANTHAARAPAISRALGTPDALAAAAMIQLTARYRCGDLLGSEEAFQEGLPHYFDPQFFRRAGAIAQTFGNAAINAWLLGNDGAVRERITVMEEADGQLPDPYTQAFSKHMASMAHLLLENFSQAAIAARESLEIAARAGFPQYEAIARITLGGALCGQSDAATGLPLMRDGLQRMQHTGSRAAITLYHAWLAQAEQAAGQPQQALGTIERGLRACLQERYVIPELLRIRAELEHQSGRREIAATLLGTARAKAQEMAAAGLYRRILATEHALADSVATG